MPSLSPSACASGLSQGQVCPYEACILSSGSVCRVASSFLMLCFHAERKTSSRALPLCTGSARTPPRRPSQPLGATATQLGISSCAEQPFSGSLAVLEPVMKMDCGCSVNSGTRSSRAIGWPAGAIRMGHLRASGGECAAASRRLIAPSARTAHATRPRCRSVVSECSKSSTRDGLRTRSAVLQNARPPRDARRTIKLQEAQKGGEIEGRRRNGGIQSRLIKWDQIQTRFLQKRRLRKSFIKPNESRQIPRF